MKGSYWLATAELPSFPPLSKKITVDVAVVGGGMTGLTTAHFLALQGLKVALLERHSLAQVDTANTTSHLTYVTDKRLSDLVRDLGENNALALWRAGQRAIQEIENIVLNEEIECCFSRVPGFLLPAFESNDSQQTLSLASEAEFVAARGFEAEMISTVPPFNCPGIRFDSQARFHPLQYLKKLTERLVQRGVMIFENSAVLSVNRKPLVAKTDNGSVNCGHIVIATHNPLVGTKSIWGATLLQTRLSLRTSYVIGGRTDGHSIPDGCYWDLSDPYYYLRTVEDGPGNYVIFGGKDSKTGQSRDETEPYKQLFSLLRHYLPTFRLEREWSGQIIETLDGLPYIGPNDDRQFIATGFCGNGITFGTLAAMMASDWVLSIKNPYSELLNPNRSVPIRQTINYFSENIDYPLYLLKDRLDGEHIQSPDLLTPGEGAVSNYEGKKVAAFRDVEGKLHLRSAICPHLGCVVRWNPAETTWDCPCHGSRFKATGEVLAGPAEKDLQKI